MALEIPALNLFMMCPKPRGEAFRQLPQGYHARLCRPEELSCWKELNSTNPESIGFLDDYFQRVYAKEKELFFQKVQMYLQIQDQL